MKTSNNIFGTLGLMFALVIAAGCASSPDTASASAAIEEDPDRMVCRRVKETGSRLASRTCKTAADWEEERLLNQEMMRNRQRSAGATSDMPTAGEG